MKTSLTIANAAVIVAGAVLAQAAPVAMQHMQARSLEATETGLAGTLSRSNENQLIGRSALEHLVSVGTSAEQAVNDGGRVLSTEGSNAAGLEIDTHALHVSSGQPNERLSKALNVPEHWGVFVPPGKRLSELDAANHDWLVKKLVRKALEDRIKHKEAHPEIWIPWLADKVKAAHGAPNALFAKQMYLKALSADKEMLQTHVREEARLQAKFLNEVVRKKAASDANKYISKPL